MSLKRKKMSDSDRMLKDAILRNRADTLYREIREQSRIFLNRPDSDALDPSCTLQTLFTEINAQGNLMQFLETTKFAEYYDICVIIGRIKE